MVNKIVLLLSMTLNLVLALVVFQSNKPIKLTDFRDALSDTPTTAQLMNNSLAGIAPELVPPGDAAAVPVVPVAPALAPVLPAAPAVEPAPVTAAAPIAPVAPIVPIKTAALMIKGGNDWTAYKQDAAEDSDVFISNIFRSRKNGEKAVAAAVRRTKARGKNVLFSCLLPEKSGGVFYVIRMAPPEPQPEAEELYLSDLGEITAESESEIQVMY